MSSPCERNKNAILEILYGMNLNQANNLLKKYGDDIDNINLENIDDDKKNSIKFVQAIKKIFFMTPEQMEELRNNSEFVKFLENGEKVENIDLVQIESVLEKAYRDIFNEGIYQIKEEDQTDMNISYAGKKIPVYEVPSKQTEYCDFSAFIRVEGAYDPSWKSPENYQKYLDSINVKYHGNCESLISQSLIATPRIRIGPVFGYESINKILMCSPWDIASTVQDDDIIASSNNKWSYARGIQYNTKENFINNTRHPHNEFVSERFLEDETGNLTRRKPSYIVLFKDKTADDLTIFEDENFRRLSNEDKKRLEIEKNQYDESKKAAMQLGIPIVVIDREKFAIQELHKIKSDLIQLKDMVESKSATPKEKQDLMRDIIVRFENNATGERHCKNDFFSDNRRREVLDWVKTILKTQAKSDYYEDLKNFQDLIKSEREKYFTSTYLAIDGESKTLDEYYLQIDNELALANEKIPDLWIEKEQCDKFYQTIRETIIDSNENGSQKSKTNYGDLLKNSICLEIISRGENLERTQIDFLKKVMLMTRKQDITLDFDDETQTIMAKNIARYVEYKTSYMRSVRTDGAGILAYNQNYEYLDCFSDQEKTLGNIMIDSLFLANDAVGLETKDEAFGMLTTNTAQNPTLISYARKMNAAISKKKLEMNLSNEEFREATEGENPNYASILNKKFPIRDQYKINNLRLDDAIEVIEPLLVQDGISKQHKEYKQIDVKPKSSALKEIMDDYPEIKKGFDDDGR